MKVKVGNKIYDGEKEPVMVILNEYDKANITHMGKQTKYCSFPEEISEQEILDFMDTGKCSKCGQEERGQTGEYPCPECGIPTVHDEPQNEQEITL